MNELFQNWRVQLTHMVEFSEAVLSTVSTEIIISQERGLLPKASVLSDEVWRQARQDHLNRILVGKISRVTLSTSHGFGLLILKPADYPEGERRGLRDSRQPVEKRFQPLVRCDLQQKAFVALHCLDLLEKLGQLAE